MLVSSTSLECLEAKMLQQEQVEILVTNYFTDNGLYAREILIPAGTIAIIGHAHNHQFMEGTIVVPSSDGLKEITAPYTAIGVLTVYRTILEATECGHCIHYYPNTRTIKK